MTKPGDQMERGEGERLYAQRRRRFWTILGGLALLGAVAGFVFGFISGHSDAGGTSPDPLFMTLAAAGVVLAGFLTAFLSWRFFENVDELEIADNLWASLIGFYAYAILFPVWWALHQLGKAPEPDDWLIFGAVLLTATAAYAIRKWLAR